MLCLSHLIPMVACGSWLFSRALVEAYSEASSSGSRLSVLLKSMPSPQAFSSHGRTMVASLPSRYGMTSERLTAFHGEELLTWFREDFLAKTSHYQARGA